MDFDKGTKNDLDKPMVSLIEPMFIEGMAKVLTLGIQKYQIDNWKKDLSTARIISALYRHLLAYHDGEITDPESGLSHLYHIACNAMFLDYYDRQEKQSNKSNESSDNNDIYLISWP